MNNMKEEIKQRKIYRNYNYGQLRARIIKRNLSVNTPVQLDKEYQLEFFDVTGKFKFILTILHLAIFLDDEEFVDYLLANNVDTKLDTEHVGPVIYLAIKQRQLKYVRKLIDAGAAVNEHANLTYLDLRKNKKTISCGFGNYLYYYDDYTPLEYAVAENAYEIVEFLISRGAEVNCNDSSQACSTPLVIATVKGNIKMMELLIKHGADINFVDASGFHDSPLLKGVSTTWNFQPIKFLISQPTIEINQVDEDGDSCLHLVVGREESRIVIFFNEDILTCLLDAGCDVNLLNNQEQLPVEIETDENLHQRMIIKHHIVKLIAANIYVCTRNEEAVSGLEFINTLADCDKEIKLLRTTQEPITGLSYYDILHKSQHKLALRFRNEDHVDLEDVRDKFPMYGGMITYRLKKAGQRRELFNKVENTLYEIFNGQLPATSIHEIFFYLSNSDLNKLIKKN